MPAAQAVFILVDREKAKDSLNNQRRTLYVLQDALR